MYFTVQKTLITIKTRLYYPIHIHGLILMLMFNIQINSCVYIFDFYLKMFLFYKKIFLFVFYLLKKMELNFSLSNSRF